MLHKSDKARCVKILQYINDIHTITSRHGGASPAFDDIEGHHAIMMCLLQIGELANKISDNALRVILETRKIVAFRNIVAHEYDALDNDLTIAIITDRLPDMEREIITVLSREDDFNKLREIWESHRK